MTAVLTRRQVWHALVRARNTRIADRYDDSWPLFIVMHPFSLEEVEMDSDLPDLVRWDPATGSVSIATVPVLRSVDVPIGEVQLRWEEPAPASSTEEASSDG